MAETDEEDSRVASLGRKRERDVSPMKGQNENQYVSEGSSKRARLEDDSSSASSPTPTPSLQNEERAVPTVQSRSHSPVAHTESAQEFISFGDISGPEDESSSEEEGEVTDDDPPATHKPSKTPHDAMLDLIDWNVALALIKEHERPRCETIVSKNRNINKSLTRGLLVFLEAQVPETLTTSEEGNVSAAQDVLAELVRHVGRRSPKGPICAKTPVKIEADARVVHMAIVYQTTDSVQLGSQIFVQEPLPQVRGQRFTVTCVGPERAKKLMDPQQLNFTPKHVSKDPNLESPATWLTEGYSLNIVDSIKSGKYHPNSYKGFPEGLNSIRKDRVVNMGNQPSAPTQAQPRPGDQDQPITISDDSNSASVMIIDPPRSQPAMKSVNGNDTSDGVIKGETIRDLPSPEPTVREELEDGMRIDPVPKTEETDGDRDLHLDEEGVRTRLWQLTDYERELQRLYFDSYESNDIVHCTICSKPGHMPEKPCPSRKCAHCGVSDDHFSNQCPTHQKCQRCRERGHDKANCPSKLSLTASDRFTCDLCNRAGHTEDECWYLWHTPQDPKNVQKVDIDISCYACGGGDHLGGDCPVRKPQHILSGVVNWTTAEYMNPYLKRPLRVVPPQKFYRDGEGPALGLSRPPDRAIRGRHGHQPGVIELNGSESEGDAGTFLAQGGAPNKKKKKGGPKGKIPINAPTGPALSHPLPSRPPATQAPGRPNSATDSAPTGPAKKRNTKRGNAASSSSTRGGSDLASRIGNGPARGGSKGPHGHRAHKGAGSVRGGNRGRGGQGGGAR